MHHTQALLKRREQITEQHHLLVVECLEIAQAVKAGQFIHMRVTGTTDPLLRRPFSVMLAERHRGELQVLVQTVGRGTEILSHAVPGNVFDILGPLGTPWPLPQPGQRPLLIGGGIGAAPLVFLADTLQELPGDCYVRGLLGGRSEDLLVAWLEMSARCEEFDVATDDGSAGRRGFVTDLLAEHLGRGDVDVVYACGPTPMLRKTAQTCAELGTQCWVSLEQWMGCGVGACLGCVIPTVNAGVERYQRICTDGPVFDASVIAWEEYGNHA